MADPFYGEIRMFPFTFAPRSWAFCDGQLMPLSQNTALFSLLGTIYGGNGKSNFALPDLQARVPLHHGQGPGLVDRVAGEAGGSETVTLLQSEMPAHTHSARAAVDDGEFKDPGPARILGRSIGAFAYKDDNAPQPMHPSALTPAGSSLPHNNMQPYLTLHFCIALAGVFPRRP